MLLGMNAAGAIANVFIPMVEAASIVTEAFKGNAFSVTLTASRTLANPTKPVGDGQAILWAITQGGAGSFLLTLDTQFSFGSTLASITLSTTPGLTDLLCAVWRATPQKWWVTAFVAGF